MIAKKILENKKRVWKKFQKNFILKMKRQKNLIFLRIGKNVMFSILTVLALEIQVQEVGELC